MSETTIPAPATLRRPRFNTLKIIGLFLLRGPPVGGVLVIVGGLLLNTVRGQTLGLLNARVWANLTADPGASLHGALIITFATAAFVYVLGVLPAFLSALLFALADRLAPCGWSRPWIGALCGLAMAPIGFGPAHAFVEDSGLGAFGAFLATLALATLPPASAGAVCARAARRAGLAKPPATGLSA